MKIDENGNVEPNALDHIFYSRNLLDLQFSIRDAAVIDEKRKIIDSKNRVQFIEALKKWQTASDHFANIIVVKR